jgi:hypothetical protein
MSDDKPTVDFEGKLYIDTKRCLSKAVDNLIEAGLGISKSLELNFDYARGLADEYTSAQNITLSYIQIHLLVTRLLKDAGQEALEKYVHTQSSPRKTE